VFSHTFGVKKVNDNTKPESFIADSQFRRRKLHVVLTLILKY
jgi:hypothetical protein